MTSDSTIGEGFPPAPPAAGPKRTVAIHTHGCKLNQADSQDLARRFAEAGYTAVGPSDAADIIILNSCTVTATADTKARQFLRAARRRNPDAVVVATGCYAERTPFALKNMSEVSLVIGNSGKSSLFDVAHHALESQEPKPVARALQGTRATGRTRAMVKIQEGCDQVCAYCIVPKVRGRERSIPPEAIVAEINRQVADGYREVALTGTQLGTYGFDLDDVNLERLLQFILDHTIVERLRVSSLQAHEISDSLLRLWGDRRLMPHFHIPLQSGCDSVLKAMRRRYDTDRFAASLELVRTMYPDAGVTTDIIAGFPGETSADFGKGLAFVERMQLSDIHAFPYSQRPGTSAAYLQAQVPESEKKSRMGEMLDLAAESRTRFRETQMGRVRKVLWQRISADGCNWSGLTDNYLRTKTVSRSPLSNEITDARLLSVEGDWVRAEVLE